MHYCHRAMRVRNHVGRDRAEDQTLHAARDSGAHNDVVAIMAVCKGDDRVGGIPTGCNHAVELVEGLFLGNFCGSIQLRFDFGFYRRAS